MKLKEKNYLKKRKKYESIGLTCQIKSTRQIWDPWYESVITK